MDSLNNKKDKIKDESNIFSEHIIKISKDKTYYGRLNAPTSAAWMKGLCGDEMEFYLVIENNIITEIKFYTDGCVSTHACGNIAADLAKGNTVYDALNISPYKVLEKLYDMPRRYHHCAILAVSTLYKAIADYMLQN